MIDLKGSFLFGATWALPYRYGRLAKAAINSARDADEVAFRTNFLCEWVGSIDGALVSANDLIAARTLKFKDLFRQGDRKRLDGSKNTDDKYVIAVDVAGAGMNMTSIVIGKILKNPNGRLNKVQIVSMTSIPTSGDFSEDAIFIKKLFFAYGGSEDMIKSKVKAIVVDTNGIGQGLTQELMNNHFDPETNTNLISFGLLFEEDSKITKVPETKNSPKVVWDLIVSGKQNDIIVNFINMFKGHNVQMAKTYEAMKADIIDDLNKEGKKKYELEDFYGLNLGVDVIDIEYQCNQVTAFINEVANLKTVISEDTKALKVKQITKAVNKDRFSAISYLLYYAKMYMDEEETEETYDINDIVSISFGANRFGYTY